MAVIIDSATAAPEVVNTTPGEYIDGFTAGDAQAGIKATQITPEWCNAVTGEIDSVIVGIHGIPDVVLESGASNWNQMKQAINYRFVNNYPKTDTTDWRFQRRSQYLTGTRALWLPTEGTDSALNVPDDADYDLCSLAVPDEAQFFFEYTFIVVSAGGLTTRYITKWLGTGRRSGGTVTIQGGTQLHTDDVISGNVTTTIIGSGTNVKGRVSIASGAPNCNITVVGKIIPTTTGT